MLAPRVLQTVKTVWGRGCCHLHRNFWYIILSELLYLYDYVVNPFNQDFPFWTSTQVFSVSRSLSYYCDWVSQCMSYTNRNECLSLQAFQFFWKLFSWCTCLGIMGTKKFYCVIGMNVCVQFYWLSQIFFDECKCQWEYCGSESQWQHNYLTQPGQEEGEVQ